MVGAKLILTNNMCLIPTSDFIQEKYWALFHWKTLHITEENALYFWFPFVFKTAGRQVDRWSHLKVFRWREHYIRHHSCICQNHIKTQSKLHAHTYSRPQMIHAETKHCFLIVLSVFQSHFHTGFLSPFCLEVCWPQCMWDSIASTSQCWVYLLYLLECCSHFCL